MIDLIDRIVKRRFLRLRYAIVSLTARVAMLTLFAAPTPAQAGKILFPPPPPPIDKPYFYASSSACANSGRFSAQDCENAFSHVQTLMQERAPRFSDEIECVLQFKLCEKDSEIYRPQALGVEIDATPRGFVAIPVLAVETPRDMLRDPETANSAADGDFAPGGARRPSVSPYGVLALDAARMAAVPPSLSSYRLFIERVQIRLAAYQQGARRDPLWRSER